MAKGSARERVNMRLPSHLVRWAKQSAKDLDVSFTTIVALALEEAMTSDRNGKAVARRPIHSREIHAADV